MYRSQQPILQTSVFEIIKSSTFYIRFKFFVHVCKGNVTKKRKWPNRNNEYSKVHIKERERNKIYYHLDEKNVTVNNLLNYVEYDKNVLLYILYKIKKQIERNNNNNNKDIFHDLYNKVIDQLSKKQCSLNLQEKLFFLSCVVNKKCAERIDLTRKEDATEVKDRNGKRVLPKAKERQSENEGENENEKYRKRSRSIKKIEEKNVLNYFFRILKNRKNHLQENEIEEDLCFFLQNRIAMHMDNISLYLLNVSYLNRKCIMKTDMLFLFVLYLLKYIKNKIKKRMSLIQISPYIALLTSIIQVSKMKRESSLKLLDNLQEINKLKIINKNEYIFEFPSGNICNINIDMPSDSLCADDVIYDNNKKFFHYYNINQFILKKENDECFSDTDASIRSQKKGMAKDMKQNNHHWYNNYVEQHSLKTCNNNNNDKEVLKNEIARVIHFTNTILFRILRKTQNKGNQQKGKKFINVLTKFPLVINYLFECLYLNMFCDILCHKCLELAIFLHETDDGATRITSKEFYNNTNRINDDTAHTNYRSNNKKKEIHGNIIKAENPFFLFVSPTEVIQLLHIMSLLSMPRSQLDKTEKMKTSFLESCLYFLIFNNENIDLSKKDLVLLYQSTSKLLFFSKRKYLEKLHVMIIDQLVNFTHRDLYNIVYSLKCSEYVDLPFIETLLRYIYKFKHKFSDDHLRTIISIFYQFITDLSIFNLLISYANNRRNSITNTSSEEVLSSNEQKEDPVDYKKNVEQDLENKERILRELSAHIKPPSTENFVFSEEDMLELNSENVSHVHDVEMDMEMERGNETGLTHDTQEKESFKKKKRKRKLNETRK